MNYIRGAVYAISAPYQYYKDLPPINPSTLTGAIDVIVIQRPTDNGDTELVCSPFHVRFGKWQVLRPGEKKVNVSVNGHPIPFNMKIGEAGEAFFVFETDDDVPEDLITSPLLQPTRPDEAPLKDAHVLTADVAAHQGPDLGAKLEPHPSKHEQELLRKEEPTAQEPEFLDLDAQPTHEVDDAHKNVNTTPRQSYQRLAPTSDGKPPLPSPPLTPTHQATDVTPEMAEQDQRVDAALKDVRDSLHVPEVEYQHHLALDAEGYHAHHDRERRLPARSKSPSTTPSPVRDLSLKHTDSDSAPTSSVSFPSFRGASDPSRDGPAHQHHPSSKLTISTVQEYSWEWGAFPQPSPMKSSFGKGGRIEGSLGRSWDANGTAKAEESTPDVVEGEEDGREHEHEHEQHGRSWSVPPELEGSPILERRVKELVEDYDGGNDNEPEEEEEEEFGEEGHAAVFGQGGKLKPSKEDPCRFLLQIEGRKVVFELSVVQPPGDDPQDGHVSQPEEFGESEEPRGRRNRNGRLGGERLFDGRDEVEAVRLFEEGKIDFNKFMEDEELVNDPGLVIRWAGDQYITRKDGSPLMQALTMWRDAARQQKAQEQPSRPTSPLSDQETEPNAQLLTLPSFDKQQPEERQHHHRSKSEPPEKAQGKPSSSSWTQWWSRSSQSRKQADSEAGKEERDLTSAPVVKSEQRPGLRGTTSAPLGNGGVALPDGESFNLERPTREVAPAESAPAYPSTPVQGPVKTSVPTPVSPETGRKFAKTLRLTSDQLKSLNLKPGANTITFSLSTSGAIACTARIFVWDSTDLVVVSDIDGTITKSDGLGHVFAMIGRDWTHLGVAKLYTDIRRNGYKIMYLTSRAIGQADATRDYLKGIKQNDYQLPEGPVIMSPDRLMASLHREVIMRKPEVFKMACLRDIQRLFGEASRNPFYAGFGNRITDALSYRSVNVPSARIFTIDSSGEVKMELLELAGYKSSYIHMTDLVDQMFPPIHRKWTPEFTDFNYWKPPIQEFPLPDLSPPSPALSARSDSSNRSALARLRNFSLVPSRQGTTHMSPPPEGEERRNSHLRQISSFEKLSNTLGFSQTSSVDSSRRSVSPESSTSYDSEDDEGEDGNLGRKRERRRSMTSMPGTLDEMHYGMDDDDDEAHFGEDGEGGGNEDDHMMDDEDAGDEAFDEDLLAAVEMKNVPFL